MWILIIKALSSCRCRVRLPACRVPQELDMNLGFPELLILFVVALIVFGPRKLPEIGKSIGKSLAEFKRASNELRRTLEEEIRLDEQRPSADASRTAAPAGSTAAELPPEQGGNSWPAAQEPPVAARKIDRGA
jgi:sec-independent protein translocase protein TatA